MTVHLTGDVSLTKRPDAISLSYMQAYCQGPIAQSNTSGGLTARLWRLTARGNEFWLARTSAEGEWESEFRVFTSPAADIQEVDLAFDQNGSLVVVAERLIAGSREVWLWWFNPISSAYEFVKLTAGRTPRLLLDDTELNSQSSDLLLFYLNDATNQAEYRIQRDRYTTVYAAPIKAENCYLEDVLLARDNRVHVYYSQHDPVRGRYALKHIESKLLPWPFAENQLIIGAEPRSIELLNVVIAPELTAEAISIAAEPRSIELLETLIEVELPEESVTVGAELQLIELFVALIEADIDPDAVSVAAAPQSIELTFAAFNYEIPVEATTVAATPQSISLEPE